MSDSPDLSTLTTLEELRVANNSCERCQLALTRQKVVFGEGNPKAALLIVGEAPGRLEDETGRPFIGPSGKLLTELLESAGLTREDVFITSVVKSRPPGNRDPRPEEVSACAPWLDRQLELLPARTILTVGNFATRSLLGTKEGVTKLRGSVHPSPRGHQVVPTFHPAAILRTRSLRPLGEHDYALAAETARAQVTNSVHR